MFKTILSVVISLSLILSPINAVAQEVFQGGWEDGVEIRWVCPPKTKGEIPFALRLPSGEIYKGVLSCGQPV